MRRLLRRVSTAASRERTPESGRAFHRAISSQPPEARCLSIGGGPTVVDDRLINLNLHAFDNVHVVGTAYQLPFGDGSIDAVYCEAVLEHLERPEAAVREMMRVLGPGGQVFAATPFLQVYHSYPDHYQNFTLTGHSKLFERAGFEIEDSGVCMGPTFALLDVMANYCREYVPTRVLSRGTFYLLRLCALVLAPLDRWLNSRANSHVVASSTFVHAVKPL